MSVKFPKQRKNSLIITAKEPLAASDFRCSISTVNLAHTNGLSKNFLGLQKVASFEVYLALEVGRLIQTSLVSIPMLVLVWDRYHHGRIDTLFLFSKFST